MAIEDNESTNWIIEITEEKRLDCLAAYSWVALEKIRNSISADPEIEAWPEGKDRIASWIAYVYLSYTSVTFTFAVHFVISPFIPGVPYRKGILELPG